MNNYEKPLVRTENEVTFGKPYLDKNTPAARKGVYPAAEGSNLDAAHRSRQIGMLGVSNSILHNPSMKYYLEGKSGDCNGNLAITVV
jgi:hypothetical protein